MALSKSELLAKLTKPRTHTFHVPALGADVCIRMLSEAQAIELGKMSETNDPAVRSRFAELTLCDPETGELFFAAEDSRTLTGFDYEALDQIWDVGAKWCKLVPSLEPEKNASTQ
jgi:hypothetical protein